MFNLNVRTVNGLAVDQLNVLIKNPNLTFGEYAHNFYCWDQCYCKDKSATGKRISKHHAIVKQSQID
jgi:hypothetical protein